MKLIGPTWLLNPIVKVWLMTHIDRPNDLIRNIVFRIAMFNHGLVNCYTCTIIP